MVSDFVWLTTVEVGCVAFLNRLTWGAHVRDTYDAAHACNKAKNVANGVAVKHSHRAGVATTEYQIPWSASMEASSMVGVKYSFTGLTGVE